MFRNYFKTSFRNLWRHKGYAAINIIGLATGLMVFWLIVLYVADDLSYDRYNKNADRIFRVVQSASWDGGNMHLAPTSAPFAPAMKARFPEVEEATRIDIEGGGVIDNGTNKLKVNDIIFADKNILKVFSYDFLYGDHFAALDNPTSIVITQSLAEKLFGSAANAINKTVYFDDHKGNLVTGVIKDLPTNAHLRFSAVRPLPEGFTEGWQDFHMYTYLLLKPGADYLAMEKKLPAFAAATIQKEMKVNDYRMALQPLTSIHLHSNLDYEISPNGSISKVYMFISIAALILLIAIINYMNLSTARAATRVREVGVRKAIGSGKKHLAAMFMTESVIVTLVSACLALCLCRFALPLFNQLAGRALGLWRFGMVNTWLLLFVFSLVTGIINGVYPSLFLSGFKTIPALKGQTGDVSASLLFRKSLVIFQFVITVIMISSSLVIYQQLQYVSHKDLGFNKSQVLTFHVDDKAVRAQIPALKAALLKSPLIESVASAGNPIGNNDLGGHGYQFEKNDGSMAQSAKMAEELVVDEDFLPTTEIKLLAGRNFSKETPADQYGAALINETLMQELGWKDAINKTIQFKIDDKGKLGQRRVVGVVKDFHTYSLQHKVASMVLLMPPYVNAKDNMYVRIAKGKTAEGVAYLQQVYSTFDKSNTTEYHFLDENFEKQYAAEKTQGQTVLLFTGFAILIACLGLFGLAMFTAQQRIKEIGIRKVLGASVSDIVSLISKDFLKLVIIASLVALPVAWILMYKWLQDFAYRIHIKPWVLLLAALAATLLALITIGIQAFKAALANPAKSIRTE